jgi:DNA-binding transcriptional regulator YiaG
MLQQVSLGEVKSNCIIVECGGTELFHYPQCGLEYVYLKGGIEEAKDKNYEGWFKFNDLTAVHRDLCAQVLTKPECIGPSEFTFLRKFIELTLVEFCSIAGIDCSEVELWLAGEAFKHESAVASVSRFSEMELSEAGFGRRTLSSVVNKSLSA